MSDEESSIFYKVVRRYHIPYGANTSNAEVISEIYQYLAGSYRNEYLYKNTLLNKLLINAHRINTTVALTEVPIANSKADFIMINGKAVVYEIKTELDTFERLENQIKDYYKAFDHVCVVTSETQESALLEKLSGTPTGLYILTKKNTIRKPKEPEEYRQRMTSVIEQILGVIENYYPKEFELLKRLALDGRDAFKKEIASSEMCSSVLTISSLSTSPVLTQGIVPL